MKPRRKLPTILLILSSGFLLQHLNGAMAVQAQQVQITAANPASTEQGTVNGTQNYIEGMAIQPDGKIVATGAASPDIFTGDFALVRYNPDGSLDTTFGPSANGVVLTDFSSRDTGTGGVALQPNGRIVMAGSAGTSSSTTYVVLLRYMP